MTIIEFINNNLSFEYGGFVACIMLGIIWLVVYDFYHLLFNAVVSWFRKDTKNG